MTYYFGLNTFRWFFIMGIQICILNNIYLGGIYNPYIYVLVILSLPVERSIVWVLFIGFFTGFILDIFMHTLGMHTMALTLLSFFRYRVLKLVSPRDGFDFGFKTNISDMGLRKYSIYALILIFSHHLLLFMLEGFEVGLIWLAIKKTIVNTLITYVLVILFQSFTPMKKKK